MTVKRGELYYADLSPVVGSEQGGIRPVLEGNLSKPARQTLRQIPFDMAGTDWYLQYSPYVYYNEHCIALSSLHTPMKIDRSSFANLL